MTALTLTFDDGPDPRWTARVLDALDACGGRATFFVIAPRALAEPALVERMVAAGHGVELHCDEHIRHGERSRGWVAADTDRALTRLEALGVRPQLWRTPWGDCAPWSGELAAARGLTLVGWTHDTHDWRGDSAAAIDAAIGPRLHAGSVVLCHDGLGPGACRDGCEQTVAFVARAAERARALGLALMPLGPDGTPLHPDDRDVNAASRIDAERAAEVRRVGAAGASTPGMLPRFDA
ncbi:polysaccharide deacetylase family protein [Conexibacter sp. JD483]|uniref:polysaccharide deacetylase family protein n=1 Tax=unclassified Conexibacter TaxID=2627773 RepID=UPI0027276867|nr:MULTISPECIES: polysaccharide deacetylase family protein [unclassified Conexibacter]MDO8186430.1 polysaccharide deacetylase family protein [Conexibacter sp. CPCC 205706]MDO8199999.1 polysaccharide deacetylase family protein [Conexibacter sp. CPCC 205762]MDR9370552.1 polysaccharide deacetylase family protein [Conexibacter sp. JD483]